MPDNVVEIKIIGSGISETGSQFEGFSEEASAALKQISAAAGVTAGDLNILQSVMKADADAGIALSATLKDVASANGELSAAVRAAAADLAVDAAATEELAAASEHLVPALTEAEAATTRLMSSQTEARYAAQLLGRELGVPLPRALSSLGAQSALLGPILEAAFPVIAAVALIDAVEALWHKIDPLNKAEKELAETTKRLDREYENLGRQLERLQVQQITAEFGKAAGAKLAFFQAGSDINEDKARIKELGDEISKLQSKLASGQNASAFPGFIGQILTQHNEAAAQDKIRELTDEMNFLQQKVVVDTQQANTDLAKARKDAAAEGTAAVRKNEQELKAAYDGMFADLQADHEVTKAEQLAFRQEELAELQQWGKNYVNLQREVSRQIGVLQQEVDRQQDAALKKAAADKHRADVEALKMEDDDFADKLRQQQQHEKLMAAAERKAAEDAKKRAGEARRDVEYGSAGKIGGLENQRSDTQVKLDESTSPIDRLKYLEQLKEIDRQIIQEKTQTQVRLIQLDSLNNPEKLAEDQAKLAAIQAQGQRTMAKDTEAIYNEIKHTVDGAISTIGNDITKNLNQWVTGQKTFGQAMTGVWRDLEMSAITSIEHIIEKQLEQIALTEILKALGIDADPKAAADEQISANVGEAQSYAALAGGTEFADALASSGGDIPYALLQAGIATSIGETFAGAASVSAAAGADLPNYNTLGFLHPREMVLPREYADVIRSAAGRGGSSRTSNVNVGSVNYSGPQMTEKHFGQMVKRLQRNSNQ